MESKQLPTKEYLNEVLNYDPETGLLRWKVRALHHFNSEGFGKSWNSRWANKEAFTHVNSSGYRTGGLLGELWGAHRVIYKLITGVDPDQVDHIDGDKVNNRFENLRSVSAEENMRNQKQRVSNSSGITGVYWHSEAEKWCAAIRAYGTPMQLGYFDSLEAAATVRKAAEVKYGYHENHGRIVT
jgi:hypothetical protein